jgi:hypothetical protein
MSRPLPLPGDRVSYKAAGRAQRQAHERARACGELTRADLIVLANVLDATTSYSRLADRESARKLARGVSERQARRSLGSLAQRGIIVWVAGRGRGNLTIVGVPPAGVKADDYQSALQGAGLAAFPSGAEPEKGTGTGAKSGQPTRAREGREVNRGVRTTALTEEEVGPTGSSSRPKLATEDGEGPPAVEGASLGNGSGAAPDVQDSGAGSGSFGTPEPLFECEALTRRPKWA